MQRYFHIVAAKATSLLVQTVSTVPCGVHAHRLPVVGMTGDRAAVSPTRDERASVICPGRDWRRPDISLTRVGWPGESAALARHSLVAGRRRHGDHSGGADPPRGLAWHPQDGPRPGHPAGRPATRPIWLVCFPHAPRRRVLAEAGARSWQRRRPSAIHSGQAGDQRAAAVRLPDRVRLPEVAAVRNEGVAGPRCAAGLSAAIVTCPAGHAGPAAWRPSRKLGQLPAVTSP